MRIALILLVLVLFGIYSYTDEIRHPPGVLVPQEPYQRILFNAPGWTKDGFRFTPLADFDVRARVLDVTRYWFDSESSISPIDLALGWGPMSDSAILDRLSISQGRRWLRWAPRGGKFPISSDEINSHSANMHMVPADDSVAKALRDVRTGEIVELSGYLVQVEGRGGWKWRSSLSRTDTGNGACELVWVRRLKEY